MNIWLLSRSFRKAFNNKSQRARDKKTLDLQDGYNEIHLKSIQSHSTPTRTAMMKKRQGCLAASFGRATLEFGVLSLSPTSSVESTINKRGKDMLA